MSYLKDDYADEDWDDPNEDNNYDEEALEPSDYENSSQDQGKKLKTRLQSDDEKGEHSDEEKHKDEEEDDLESIEQISQHLMIMDLIPDVKKEELDLIDEFQALDIKANTERITCPFISKYQKAMVIGKRAQQIGKNSPIYVALSEDEVKRLNSLEIAEQEYEMGAIPMIIRRYLPDRTFEDWKLRELKRLAW